MPNNPVQVLRSSVVDNRPTGKQPGEPYVNYADMQFGVVDTSGTARDLLAVTFFATTSHYDVGEFVVQAGSLYRCISPNGPGAFNPANWSQAFTAANAANYLLLAGGTMSGPIVLAADPAAPLQAATKQYADLKAPIASPVFTGDPQAPTPPPGDNDASVATTAFVAAGFAPIVSPVFTGDPKAPTAAPGDNDTSLATTAFVATALGNSGVVVADTPPAGPLQGKLWFDSVSGQLYVFYNDGNSSQWVVATNNSPDLSSYAPLTSPVLTGDPKAPTPTVGDNDTSIATTAFVAAAIAASKVGVTDGSNAAAGQVGEFVTVAGTAIAIATTTYTDIASLVLQPGDWDVWGVTYVTAATAGSITQFYTGITQTSGGFTDPYTAYIGAAFGNGTAIAHPARRVNITVPTSVIVEVFLAFTGAVSVRGTIYARRRR